MNKKIAVDFDGTLCEYAFPEIGKQNKEHRTLKLADKTQK